MKKYILNLLLVIIPIIGITQSTHKVITDIVYEQKADTSLTFDVYMPADSSNGAGIINLVSGAWNSRYYPPDSGFVNYAPLLDRGYTVFAMRHGSSLQFTIPEMVEDVMKGTWFIHENSYMYGVDSNRLGIFGGSSGGQLSLVAGLKGERHPVNAIVAFFAPSDLRNVPDLIKAMIPALAFDTMLAASVSPVLMASPDDPPTLLIHGTSDFVVSPAQSEKMYEALQENGVVSKLLMIEGMMHGNNYGGRGKYRAETNQEMIGWFDHYLLNKTQ